MRLSSLTTRLIAHNKKLGNTITASLGIFSLLTNSFTHGPVIWVTGIAAMALPDSWAITKQLDRLNIAIGNSWIRVNNRMIDGLLPKIQWQIDLPDDVSLDKQYILICNHQTWVDTAVMQYVGVNTMPLTRFFTKFELIYIPFVGQAFKILGFPMMKRHSKAAIAKNPQLQGQDLVEAKKACAKMQQVPFTLLNYLEGTRITPAKHAEQQSPYQHLLKPKYGGLALAFSILGEQMDDFLDMTIVYPDGIPEYMDLWRGNIRRVAVDIRKVSVPDWVIQGDYQHDAAYKEAFKQWVDTLWQEKDARIAHTLNSYTHATATPSATDT